MNKTMTLIVILLLLVAMTIFLFDVTKGSAVDDTDTQLIERIDALESRVGQLEYELEKNLLGDCLNEGVIKAMLGVPPASLVECRQERDDWMNEYENPSEPTENEM